MSARRPPGRVCFVCGKRRWYRQFTPSNARKCDPCKRAGEARSYDVECIVCGTTFTSRSPKALYCDDDRAAANAEVRRARVKRKRAAKRKHGRSTGVGTKTVHGRRGG